MINCYLYVSVLITCVRWSVIGKDISECTNYADILENRALVAPAGRFIQADHTSDTMDDCVQKCCDHEICNGVSYTQNDEGNNCYMYVCDDVNSCKAQAQQILDVNTILWDTNETNVSYREESTTGSPEEEPMNLESSGDATEQYSLEPETETATTTQTDADYLESRASSTNEAQSSSSPPVNLDEIDDIVESVLQDEGNPTGQILAHSTTSEDEGSSDGDNAYTDGEHENDQVQYAENDNSTDEIETSTGFYKDRLVLNQEGDAGKGEEEEEYNYEEDTVEMDQDDEYTSAEYVSVDEASSLLLPGDETDTEDDKESDQDESFEYIEDGLLSYYWTRDDNYTSAGPVVLTICGFLLFTGLICLLIYFMKKDHNRFVYSRLQ